MLSGRKRLALEILGVDAYRPRQRTDAAPALTGAAAADAIPDRGAAADIDPMDWSALERAISQCTLCGLCEQRNQAVPGTGARRADLMLVGEGPGAEEDRRGEPFVGRAGQLLDRMLLAIGRDRSDSAYITNIVKCRPPKNRDPEPAEVLACRPYLERQIELLQPGLILALGRVAAQNLLNEKRSLGRLRGQVHETAEGIPVLATYHPAYLLRSPGEKRKVWEDLKKARDLLEGAA